NPGESLAGGQNAAPVIGAVLSNLIKDYRTPEETPASPPTEEPTEPEAEVSEEPATEYTEDVMNPEGAPMPEELISPE
ncbi:MAG: hypothetical protein ACO3XN_04475, partial [Chthoniobacterales bacterium]